MGINLRIRRQRENGKFFLLLNQKIKMQQTYPEAKYKVTQTEVTRQMEYFNLNELNKIKFGRQHKAFQIIP